MSNQQPYDPYNSSQDPYRQSSEYTSNPYEQTNYTPGSPYAPPSAYAYTPMLVNEPGRGLALAGLILGIISMLAWLIPFFGVPISVVGIALSALGRRSISRRGLAVAGLVLSIIGLVLSICLFAAGLYVATQQL